MYCVYKNFFFLLKNNNFFVNNYYFFFFFNIYNLILFDKKKNLNLNKNFVLPLNKFDLNKKNIFLKYFSYFNKLLIFGENNSRLLYLNFFGVYKNKQYFFLNNYSFSFVKKLINLLFQIQIENKNLMILDKNYKIIFPLYNYIFGIKNLMIYKTYFFIDIKIFTYRNWIYLYTRFINKFKVVLLLIVDFFHFKKFFKILKSVNTPLSSLIPALYLNNLVDYPVIISYYSNIEKFIFSNLIVQIVIISYNYKCYSNKIKYLQIFYNFSNKFN